MPGAQAATTVADMRANRLAAPGFVQAWVDGENLAVKALARIGIQADFNKLLEADLADGLLRNTEIHLERVEHFQVDDVLTFAEVIAGADSAQTQHAIIGRKDARLVQTRLGQRQASA